MGQVLFDVGVINTEESKDSNPYTCVGKGSAKGTSLANSPRNEPIARVTMSKPAGASTKTTDSNSRLNQAYDFKDITSWSKGSANQTIVCIDRDARIVGTATDREVFGPERDGRESVGILTFDRHKTTFRKAHWPANRPCMGEASEPRPATTSKPQFVVSFGGLAFGPDTGAPMPINSKREAVKFGFCGVLPPRRWVQSLHR